MQNDLLHPSGSAMDNQLLDGKLQEKEESTILYVAYGNCPACSNAEFILNRL